MDILIMMEYSGRMRDALVEEAVALAQEISAEQMRLSRLSWALEQVLHNYRLACVGSSGITHRVIGEKADLEVELTALVAAVKAAR